MDLLRRLMIICLMLGTANVRLAMMRERKKQGQSQ